MIKTYWAVVDSGHAMPTSMPPKLYNRLGAATRVADAATGRVVVQVEVEIPDDASHAGEMSREGGGRRR